MKQGNMLKDVIFFGVFLGTKATGIEDSHFKKIKLGKGKLVNWQVVH
jgi:hypothetical protein